MKHYKIPAGTLVFPFAYELCLDKQAWRVTQSTPPTEYFSVAEWYFDETDILLLEDFDGGATVKKDPTALRLYYIKLPGVGPDERYNAFAVFKSKVEEVK